MSADGQYDRDVEIPRRNSLFKIVSRTVSLGYWDYYQDSEATASFSNHHRLKSGYCLCWWCLEVVGFTPQPFSRLIAVEANKACHCQPDRSHRDGLGDLGGEAAVLDPASTIWASYRNDLERLSAHFEAATGLSVEDFMQRSCQPLARPYQLISKWD